MRNEQYIMLKKKLSGLTWLTLEIRYMRKLFISVFLD